MVSSEKKNTFMAISVHNKKINLENFTNIILWSSLVMKVNIIKCSLLKKDQYVSTKFLLSNFLAESYSRLFNS
jgi:hypothetical protein